MNYYYYYSPIAVVTEKTHFDQYLAYFKGHQKADIETVSHMLPDMHLIKCDLKFPSEVKVERASF
jgi:hypothetical protein